MGFGDRAQGCFTNLMFIIVVLLSHSYFSLIFFLVLNAFLCCLTLNLLCSNNVLDHKSKRSRISLILGETLSEKRFHLIKIS